MSAPPPSGPGLDPDALAAETPALLRMATALTRDPHRAADLVQDTIVRALERSDQYRGDAPLGAWLRRILHNLAVDRGRRSQRELLVEDVEERWRDDAYSVDAATVVERAHDREEVEDALAHLPFHYRSTVVLHDLEGWPVREIAAMADIGLPAAKQRLRRGRMMLVTALAEGRERRALLEGVPMRCWDARRHVSDYLDGALDTETASFVEAHLEHCPTCPPLYAALVGLQDGLGGLRDPDTVVSPTLQARISAELGP
ncbi:MAG: sigma-70 family RNA polymerase sigma factor [Acidimicrobiales bacterium]|nr:sigma-70 family RNA polymerase sigma factor [Acidimicrobiales bacterium]